MNTPRMIRKIMKSRATIEGAGVHLRRAFGFQEVPMFDPFLLLDDFRADYPHQYLPGFPWHPHRGIETITYMLRGSVEHRDSLGHQGVISAGDVQWMTAGSGIVHQEMPKGDVNGYMGGFQLWANLPASQKMMEPRYQEVKSPSIPEIVLANGVNIRLICGQIGDTCGPVRNIVIEPEYLDVKVPADTEFTHPTKPDHTVFAYVIEGEGVCGDPSAVPSRLPGEDMEEISTAIAGMYTLVLFGHGDEVRIRTQKTPVRFLLISGKALNEAIAWRGPIVMNTQEELRVAFEEYRSGTFLKPLRQQ